MSYIFDKGKCYNDKFIDPEFFFTQGSSINVRRYCEGCPIQLECEAYGNENGLHGYWGGYSKRVRKIRVKNHRTLLSKLQKQMKEQLQDDSEDPIAS